MNSTQELVIIRFTYPAQQEDRISYQQLFMYLLSKNKYGVTNEISKNFKEMYMIPLPSQQAIPSYLLPFTGVGWF